VSLSLMLGNVGSWALQALVLIAVTGALLALLRVTDPGLRLRAWHGVLGAALLLPFLQRWHGEAAASPSIDAATVAARFVWEPWVAAVAGVGIVARAGWMAAGLRQLRELRLASTPWRPQPAWYCDLTADAGTTASLASSLDIDSAVTFGVRRPAILVPERLLAAPEPQQRAIVAHELHHVARRDWVWVLLEESLRIALWWHPAIWFALDEAQLAREEIVDRRAVAVIGNRASYLEALIAAAEPAPVAVIAFGPQFFRRRQLFTRVRRLLEEEAMSKARMIAAVAALAIAVPATALLARAAFPLTAADVAQRDAPPPPPPPPAPAASRPDVPPPPPPPPPPPARASAAPRRSAPPAPPAPPAQMRFSPNPDRPMPPLPPAPPAPAHADGLDATPPPPAAPLMRFSPAPPQPPARSALPVEAPMVIRPMPPVPPPPPPAPARADAPGDVPPPPPPPPPPVPEPRGSR
jgi:Zn-dependent protease with chaperone function